MGITKNTTLRRLKQDFYDWCALLSIDEIVSNAPLICSIERLERALIAACDRAPSPQHCSRRYK